MTTRRADPVFRLLRMIARHKIQKKLPLKEIKRHVLITGNSGSGKSDRLKVLAYILQASSERKKDASIVLLDPHGDLSDQVRRFRHNLNNKRVVYIDPFLREGMTPTINPLECRGKDEHDIELATQQLVGVFQELVPDALLSNQMRALLTPCLATLIRAHASSLEDLQSFLRKGKNDNWITQGK